MTFVKISQKIFHSTTVQTFLNMTLATLSVPISLSICIVFVITGLWLKNYKEVNEKNAWCHESSIAAIVGLIVGGIMTFSIGNPIVFDSDLFFYLVLPPIIFSAGYSLKRKRFFRYGLTITVFGIVGTTVNILMTSVAAHSFYYITGSTDDDLKLSWTKSLLLGAFVVMITFYNHILYLIQFLSYYSICSVRFG